MGNDCLGKILWYHHDMHPVVLTLPKTANPLQKSLFQMHRDIVANFPPRVQQLGSTAKCLNQGMYLKNKIITVQGHPEFTHDIVKEILESREEKGVYPPGVFQDGVQRLTDHDDGVLVAQAFLRFLLED
jgi:hypothetical protein